MGLKLSAVQVKSNANYTCRQCGSTELVQGHHRIPGDDSTLIALCAECHSQKHPDVPKALFFSANQQPYWHNKSASSIARELQVHSRTVIRAARRLGVPLGFLTDEGEQLIKSNTPLLRFGINVKKRSIIYTAHCLECGHEWVIYGRRGRSCPQCKGFIWNITGKKQLYETMSKQGAIIEENI